MFCRASSYTATAYAMFGAGAAALLLLFDGIHNSWDAVAYRVYVIGRNRQQPPE